MNTENTQLCPNCKTGRDSYLLDSKELFCPYIHFHNGVTCSQFAPITENETEDEQNGK